MPPCVQEVQQDRRHQKMTDGDVFLFGCEDATVHLFPKGMRFWGLLILFHN